MIFQARLAPDCRFEYVSPSCTRITGYTPDEFYADPLLAGKCIHPDDHHLVADPLVFENERQGKPVEVRWKCKNGQWIWTEHMISVLRNKQGEPESLLIIARDIDERKKAVETLVETQRFNATLLENAPHAAVVINADTSIRYVNPAWVKLNGWTLDEVVGMKTPYPWWPEQMRDAFAEGFKEALNQLTGKGEVVAQKKNGDLYWIDMNWDSVMVKGKLQYLLINSVDITERKNMEEALRESEETFSTAFHSSPDAMAIINVKTNKFVEVNDSYASTLGYTRQELIGHNAEELNLLANASDAARMKRLITEQGKIRHEEFYYRSKSGDIRIWLCSVDIINVKGEPCMLCVAADITERKKTEEALKESEQKFATAFNASPFSISISRLGDGKFIEVNERFLDDKGYTREEIIGQSSKDFQIWANQEEACKIMETIHSHGHIQNEQVQYRTKSGHIRTGLVSVAEINISNEPCMLVMNSDITQQKLAQEQLRLLSSVTQQVSDSTIITDPNFNITYMNQAAQGLYGYTLEEARGKSLNIFNAKPVSHSGMMKIMHKIAKDKVWSGIVTKKGKTGRLIACDCHFSPLYDEKGQLCSYIDVQRDVTQQKEVEAKLQEHKKLIDSILTTMTEGVLVIDSKDNIVLANKAFSDIFHISKRALQNKKLGDILPAERFFDLHKAVKSRDAEKNTLEFRFQSRGFEKIIICIITKMDSDRRLLTFIDISKERDEEEKLYLTDRLVSLGEMTAGLAHELNNPLTGILALSQMLIGSGLPEEQKEDLECINSEAKRAAVIVKNVLLFARNKTDVTGCSSINDVVMDVLRLREYEEKASNIKLVTKLKEGLPVIPIDRGQLQQIFLNLISNAEAAIKEANRPGVITISTRHINSHVNIIFKDNGCGMKKHVLPRIFDPFFTTKEIGKGTGLGLSICYSIIVKHGGKISVKSQVNEGTTFTIRMPVVTSDR
jgi:PAS domain S-box-containing protein